MLAELHTANKSDSTHSAAAAAAASSIRAPSKVSCEPSPAARRGGASVSPCPVLLALFVHPTDKIACITLIAISISIIMITPVAQVRDEPEHDYCRILDCYASSEKGSRLAFRGRGPAGRTTDIHKLSMNDRRDCKLCPRAARFGKPEKLEHNVPPFIFERKKLLFSSRVLPPGRKSK